jgi:hypothetical protein
MASAQTIPGSVTVTSNPPGAEVMLKGDATVAGVTPTVFRQTLVGSFQVQITKPGYETYTSRVIIDPAAPMQIDASLSPKTRLKAAVRSMFIPGWGQHYTEQYGKGVLLNVLAAGAVVAYFIVDHHFDQQYHDFVMARERFDNAVDEGAGRDELDRLLAELNTQQKEAFDAEDLRRITIGGAIGIWGLGVVDALMFFPYKHSTVSLRPATLPSSSSDVTPGLKLSLRF